jgi:hypothetical protein
LLPHASVKWVVHTPATRLAFRPVSSIDSTLRLRISVKTMFRTVVVEVATEAVEEMRDSHKSSAGRPDRRGATPSATVSTSLRAEARWP